MEQGREILGNSGGWNGRERAKHRRSCFPSCIGEPRRSFRRAVHPRARKDSFRSMLPSRCLGWRNTPP